MIFQRFRKFLHAFAFPVRVPRIHLVSGRDCQPTARRTETDATPTTDSRRWRHNITAASQSIAANAGEPVLATAGVHDGRQRGLDKSTQTTTAAASTRWEASFHSEANDSHLWTNVQGKNIILSLVLYKAYWTPNTFELHWYRDRVIVL